MSFHSRRSARFSLHFVRYKSRASVARPKRVHFCQLRSQSELLSLVFSEPTFLWTSSTQRNSILVSSLPWGRVQRNIVERVRSHKLLGRVAWRRGHTVDCYAEHLLSGLHLRSAFLAKRNSVLIFSRSQLKLHNENFGTGAVDQRYHKLWP